MRIPLVLMVRPVEWLPLVVDARYHGSFEVLPWLAEPPTPSHWGSVRT